MKIVKDYPPNIKEINAVFNVMGKRIFYAWGDTIYNPMGVDIAPKLVCHEMTHGLRQGDDVEGWWRRYLDEPGFRLAEEIIAHQAEFEYVMKNGNRTQRRRALKEVVNRLSGPLYGHMLTAAQAKRAIKEGM